MRVELCDCERVILAEIAEPSTRRVDVAKTYWFARRSREVNTINWPKIHQAILDRWSPHALKWIKEQAYTGKCWKDTYQFATEPVRTEPPNAP